MALNGADKLYPKLAFPIEKIEIFCLYLSMQSVSYTNMTHCLMGSQDFPRRNGAWGRVALSTGAQALISGIAIFVFKSVRKAHSEWQSLLDAAPVGK